MLSSNATILPKKVNPFPILYCRWIRKEIQRGDLKSCHHHPVFFADIANELHESFSFRKFQEGTGWPWSGLLKLLKLLTEISAGPLAHASLQVERFLVYETFLKVIGHRGRVILCDAKDVAFFKDPFAALDDKSLHLFQVRSSETALSVTHVSCHATCHATCHVIGRPGHRCRCCQVSMAVASRFTFTAVRPGTTFL